MDQSCLSQTINKITDNSIPVLQGSIIYQEKIKEIEKIEKEEKTESYPIDLEIVLELVEKQNLYLAQDKMQAKINKSQLRQKQVSLLPDITGSFSQSKLSGATQISGGKTVTVDRPTVNPQVAISWTVNPGGRQIYEILASKQRLKAADIQAQGTLQEQMTLAAQEYYKLKAAFAQKEATLKSLEQAEEQLKVSEAKLKVGNGTKLDLMNAKKLEAQQLKALTEAQNAIVQAEQNLLSRLNLEPYIHLIINNKNNIINVTNASEIKTLVYGENKLRELIERAKNNNLTLKRLETELKALDHDFKAIRSDFVPSVTLRAYVGKTGPEWNEMNRNDFLGLTATANLLNSLGFEIPFQLQEKGREREKKRLEMKAQERTLENQVTTAYLNSKNYLTAVEATRIGLEAAEESYRFALKRYETGYSSSLEVSQAQVDLAQARLDSINAILNYNQAQVQLLQAIGEINAENLLKGVQ